MHVRHSCRASQKCPYIMIVLISTIFHTTIDCGFELKTICPHHTHVQLYLPCGNSFTELFIHHDSNRHDVRNWRLKNMSTTFNITPPKHTLPAQGWSEARGSAPGTDWTLGPVSWLEKTYNKQWWRYDRIMDGILTWLPTNAACRHFQ